MKKFLAVALAAVIFALCFPVLSLGAKVVRDGLIVPVEPLKTVPAGYVGIYNATDLKNIKSNMAGKYILMNDIDLSGVGNWTPIQSSSTISFEGVLDGNGYEISNLLYHTTSYSQYAGLFANLSCAEIKNLTLDVDLSGYFAYAGGVSSMSSYSSIRNCSVTGVASANNSTIGGIVGTSTATTLEDCASNVDINVSLTVPSENCAGGIAAHVNSGMFNRCYNKGDVSALYPGGLIGYLNFEHAESFSMENCFNVGNISSSYNHPGAPAGGLIGFLWFKDSVGHPSFLIKNCYNAGVCKSTYGKAGSLIGLFEFEETGIDMLPQNFYYLSNSASSAIGGMQRVDYEHLGWLTPPSVGSSLTQQQMKAQSNFSGFDFMSIWAMPDNGTPVLKTMITDDNSGSGEEPGGSDPVDPELSTLEKWEANLPAWLGGLRSAPSFLQWLVIIFFFGWIWFL